MGSTIAILGVLGACAVALWLSFKYEPHWVSRDGQRMRCYGQIVSRSGESTGRWRELLVGRNDDTTVAVRARRGSLAVSNFRPGTTGRSTLLARRTKRPSYWRVLGTNPAPQSRKVIYLLSTSDPSFPEMLAIRLPINSRAIPMLDSLTVNPATSNGPAPRPGKPRSAAPPDRD